MRITRLEKNAVLRVCLVLAVFQACGALALADDHSENPGVAGQIATWQLTDARVVEPGRTARTAEGVITSGYTVEAVAAGNETAPIKQGIFRLTVTVFSPARTARGQEAGFWYVRGTWTLTDVAAAPEAARARYSSAVLRGSLAADKLTFNPATDQGTLEAQVRVPMYRTETSVSRASGTFKGNEKFAGQLTVTLEQRQKIPERRN